MNYYNGEKLQECNRGKLTEEQTMLYHKTLFNLNFYQTFYADFNLNN